MSRFKHSAMWNRFFDLLTANDCRRLFFVTRLTRSPEGVSLGNRTLKVMGDSHFARPRVAESAMGGSWNRWCLAYKDALSSILVFACTVKIGVRSLPGRTWSIPNAQRLLQRNSMLLQFLTFWSHVLRIMTPWRRRADRYSDNPMSCIAWPDMAAQFTAIGKIFDSGWLAYRSND